MNAGYVAKKKPWVVLPYHSGDLAAAQRLVGWMRYLGKVNTTCLLVRDARMKSDGSMNMLAKPAFAAVEELQPPHALADERWPAGANWMFETACRRMAQAGHPFLWLEPDVGLMRRTWYDELAAEYDTAGKPFMGTIVSGKLPGLPERHLTGIAVYPANALEYFPRLAADKTVAWDMTTGDRVLADAHDTPLIQHFWGTQKLPPTFVRFRGKDDPENALTLDFIKPETAIFHRCKDPSLLTLLRDRFQKSKPKSVNIPDVPGRSRTIWHVVQRFPQATDNAQRRVNFAFDSWMRLYSSQVRPVHVWAQDCSRHSGTIGDVRNLPYLKDVLDAGLKQAGDQDAIMFTNDDTVLHPDVIPAIQERLRKQPAFCSFRLNYPKGRPPSFNVPVSIAGKPSGPAIDDDIGRDLFVFTVEWLRAHWDDIPDFFLGELEWDLILALMIRKHYGIPCSGKTIGKLAPVCELPKGYVWHERHDRAWIKADFYAPAKQANWQLSASWCAKHGIDYPFE